MIKNMAALLGERQSAHLQTRIRTTTIRTREISSVNIILASVAFLSESFLMVSICKQRPISHTLAQGFSLKKKVCIPRKEFPIKDARNLGDESKFTTCCSHLFCFTWLSNVSLSFCTSFTSILSMARSCCLFAFSLRRAQICKTREKGGECARKEI
jgi:hypothetical protein